MGLFESSAPSQSDKNRPLSRDISWNIGDVIEGLYRVWGKNESGAMGIIYFVEHLGWNRKLAVKTPILTDERFRKAFIREAEIWVELGLHPHIATCFYVREIGGIPRIFIEYVDGGSLREALSGGRVKHIREVIDFAIQFCRGMDYAHGKGLVHRDIKPANCLLTRDGILKVTDFGLMKALILVKDDEGLTLPDKPEGSTIFGKSAGTPEYMAPEQFEGKTSFSSDIYAFGVMLYEMVTGRKPFEKDVHPAARWHVYREVHAKERPSDPRDLNPNCPARLRNFILRCLEKDPDRRPASFSETEEELLELYGILFQEDYPREKVTETLLLSSDLNNRALSLLDLKREDEAEKLLKQAVEKDLSHPEAVYNLTLLEWRKGRIDGLTAVKRYEEQVLKNHPDEWLPRYLLSWLHYERADQEEVLSLLQGIEGNPEVERLRSLAQSSPQMGLAKTFEGHTDRVTSVAFSPDGGYVLSGSGDKTLKLWDVRTGRCLRTFEGHNGGVFSVAFSPSGRYALSGGGDNVLKPWLLDWELEEKEFAHWDEGARPYLEIFLTLHTPYGPDGLTRQGKPRWTEDEFQNLMKQLGFRGYGWLRPEGVRRKLEEMGKR